MTPSDPGDFVRAEVIGELGLNVTKAALIPGVRRATLLVLLNGNSSLWVEMALRIKRIWREHGLRGRDFRHIQGVSAWATRKP